MRKFPSPESSTVGIYPDRLMPISFSNDQIRRAIAGDIEDERAARAARDREQIEAQGLKMSAKTFLGLKMINKDPQSWRWR